MSFTFDITNPVGKLRLHIGDRSLNAGPWPDSSNFSDEELTQLLSEEGSVIGRAAAAAAEVLAAAWASVADIAVGPRRENLHHVSEQFLKQSQVLRQRFGGEFATYSLAFKKQDGFSMYGADDPAIGANLSDYFRARVIVRRGWFA